MAERAERAGHRLRLLVEFLCPHEIAKRKPTHEKRRRVWKMKPVEGELTATITVGSTRRDGCGGSSRQLMQCLPGGRPLTGSIFNRSFAVGVILAEQRSVTWAIHDRVPSEHLQTAVYLIARRFSSVQPQRKQLSKNKTPTPGHDAGSIWLSKYGQRHWLGWRRTKRGAASGASTAHFQNAP